MEDRGLTVVEGQRPIAVVSPMEALANMSEPEFRAKLAALKRGQERLATIQREIMMVDVDYGSIPGTPRPTLLKPGAEKLCKFHHLVPTLTWQIVQGDGNTTPHIRVLMTCSLHVDTDEGAIVGQGVGAANSWEKKYRYRDARLICPECKQPAIIKGKADFGGGWLCWNKKGGCGAKFKAGDAAIEKQVLGQVENPDPYDGENTLVKMAAKRAQVDATLRVTATSGLFTQDVEDMEPVAAEAPARQGAQAEPKPAPTPVAPAPPTRGQMAIEAQLSAREQRIVKWQELRDALKEKGVPCAGITSRTSDADIETAIADLTRVLANLSKPEPDMIQV